MRFRFVLVSLVTPLVVFGACKAEDDDRPPPGVGGASSGGIGGGGGGGGRDGSADALAEAGACSDLANTGFLVDQTGVIGEPPPGQGGTVEEGTFDLTEARLYVGAAGNPAPTGVSFRGSLRISTGNVIDRVSTIQPVQGNAVNVNERSTGTFAGVNATFLSTCPNSLTRQYSFTYLSGVLTLNDLVTKESFTYVRK